MPTGCSNTLFLSFVSTWVHNQIFVRRRLRLLVLIPRSILAWNLSGKRSQHYIALTLEPTKTKFGKNDVEYVGNFFF